VTKPASWDEIVTTLALGLHAGIMEHIVRKERNGVPADIADEHKALFAVEELFAGVRGYAADPPRLANCDPLPRAVWAAIAEKLTNQYQI
jgi:hypothetical protein